MREMRVRIKTKAPGVWICRAFTWALAAATAPLTGGASFLACAVMEPVFQGGAKRIREEADERLRNTDWSSELCDSIRRGETKGSKTFTVDLGDIGFGKIKKTYEYKIL